MISRRALIGFGIAGLVGFPAVAETRRSSAIVTAQALGKINTYRSRNGADSVTIDPRAEKAALTHSEQMAYLGELNHDNFDKRLAEAQIVSPSAENIAVGQQSIDAVLSAWQNSRGHRTNLLGSYNRIGLAVARNSNSRNTPYWTLILSV